MKLQLIIPVITLVASGIMIATDHWITIALILIGISIIAIFSSVFSYIKKGRRFPPYQTIRIFLLLYLFLVVVFSLAFSGLTKRNSPESGLYTSKEKIGKCETVENYFDMLYFSAVTATTLGYGDIHPKGILPRLFVIVEVLSLPIFLICLFNSVIQKEEKPIIDKRLFDKVLKKLLRTPPKPRRKLKNSKSIKEKK